MDRQYNMPSWGLGSGGPGQYSGGPGQYRGGSGQYRGGPGQYSGGPGQYPSGPGQYPGGPGQYPSYPVKEEPDYAKMGYEDVPGSSFGTAIKREPGFGNQPGPMGYGGASHIKTEPPEIKREPVEIKQEPSEERRGEKRQAPIECGPPDTKRYRPEGLSQHTDYDPIWDKDAVLLDWYNSDLSLKIDKETFLSAEPMTNQGFAYVWHGVRSTYGFVRGRVFYEVKVEDHLDVPDLEGEMHPHVMRVGWSTDDNGMMLGEEPLSYGYGGTGKASMNLKYKDYGRPYSKGDVVGCFLDMDSEPITMSFSVNGRNLGKCYEVSHGLLRGKALFPHILTKNCSFKVNFGSEYPWFQPQMGYEFVGQVPVKERVLGTQGPQTREESEVIMMVGLPACGKTTWIEKYCRENPHKKYYVLGTNFLIDKMKVGGLNRKRNYHGRWEVLIEKCTKCLNSLLSMSCNRKRNYIIDQTNVYPSARIRKMKGYSGYFRRAVVMVPSDEEYQRRNEAQIRKEGKLVPDAAIMEMKANFTLPEESDDIFDSVEFVELPKEEAVQLVEQYSMDAQNKGYRKKPNNRGRGRGGFRGGWNRNTESNRGGGNNNFAGNTKDSDNNQSSQDAQGGFRRDNDRGGFGNRRGFDRGGNRGGGFDNPRGGFNNSGNNNSDGFISEGSQRGFSRGGYGNRGGFDRGRLGNDRGNGNRDFNQGSDSNRGGFDSDGAGNRGGFGRGNDSNNRGGFGRGNDSNNRGGFGRGDSSNSSRFDRSADNNPVEFNQGRDSYRGGYGSRNESDSLQGYNRGGNDRDSMRGGGGRQGDNNSPGGWDSDRGRGDNSRYSLSSYEGGMSSNSGFGGDRDNRGRDSGFGRDRDAGDRGGYGGRYGNSGGNSDTQGGYGVGGNFGSHGSNDRSQSLDRGRDSRFDSSNTGGYGQDNAGGNDRNSQRGYGSHDNLSRNMGGGNSYNNQDRGDSSGYSSLNSSQGSLYSGQSYGSDWSRQYNQQPPQQQQNWGQNDGGYGNKQGGPQQQSYGRSYERNDSPTGGGPSSGWGQQRPNANYTGGNPPWNSGNQRY